MDFTAQAKPVVLVVDDTPDILLLLSSLLKDRYRVKLANSGEKCLQLVQAGAKPDLILLDIMMPGINGHEVCAELKRDPSTWDIPIIFLTGMSSIADEEAGLRMGAVDYITKPISPPIVLARVDTQLKIKAASDFLKDEKHYLEQQVALRTEEVHAIQDVTILSMASLAETRDNETGNHIRRTQHYVKALAEHLRYHPRFASYLNDKQIELLFKSAPLHDIGKVGIPDRILLKPGSLTAEEFEIMKTHTTIGRDAIVRAEKQLGVSVPFLQCAKEIAYGHQEKWDGSGYPQGVAGDAIPISARLMAVADVYDALICRRVYKPAMTHEQAAELIQLGRGQHFDPDIVDAFLALQTQFQTIATTYADTEGDLADELLQMEHIAEKIVLE